MRTFIKHMIVTMATAALCCSFMAAPMVMADPVDGDGQSQTDTNTGDNDDTWLVSTGDGENQTQNRSSVNNPYAEETPQIVDTGSAQMIIYDSGIAVVQATSRGADPEMGTVRRTYVFTNHYRNGWCSPSSTTTDQKHIDHEFVTTMIFRDRVTNVTGTGFFAYTTNLTDVVNLDYMTFNPTAGVYSSPVDNIFNGLSTPANGFEDLNLTGVQNIGGLFANTTFANLDFASEYDISSATLARALFYNTSIPDTSAISSWDMSRITNMGAMFSSAHGTDTSGMAGWNTSAVTNMQMMFNSAYDMDLSGLSNWDTSHVENMGMMFQTTHDLDLSSLSNWNVSSVTNMEYMFQGAHDLNLNGLSGWRPSSVTNMRYFFYGAHDIDTTGISGWTTSAVTNMKSFLYGAHDIDLSGLSGWNVSSVTNMGQFCMSASNLDLTPLATWTPTAVTDMGEFFRATSLDITPVAGWNTPNLGSLGYTFYGATCDIPENMAWDTSHVTNFQYAFFNHKPMTFNGYHGLANWDTSSATNMNYMFYASGIVIPDYLSGWDTSNVTGMFQMFYQCKSLRNTDGMANWDVSHVPNFQEMFYQNTALVTANLNWDMSAATTMSRMFYGCTKLQSFTNDHEAFTAPLLTNVSYMFNSDSALTDISGLSKITGTTALTDMSHMLSFCKSVTSLDALANWNTSAVTNMAATFDDCWSITDASPLANWNTSSVTNMGSMFYRDWSLSRSSDPVDFSSLAGWDVSHVTNMRFMFEGCPTSDLSFMSTWNTANVTNYQGMFAHNVALHNVDLTGWNFPVINSNNGKGIFAECPNLRVITVPENSITFPANAFIESGSATPSWAVNWVCDNDDDGTLYNMGEVLKTEPTAGTYYRRLTTRLYPMGGTVDPRNIIYDMRGYDEEFPTPVWENHTFLGWYGTDGQQYTSIPENKVVSALYARWEASTYTLRLDPHMSGVEAVDIQMGTDWAYTLRNDTFPSVTDYYIDGWTTEPNGAGDRFEVGEIILPRAAADSVYTLYPVWVRNVNIPVHFHYINIETGEEIRTLDTEVLCGRTYQAMDPMPTLDDGYQIAYISTSDELDCVDYGANPSAYGKYENDSTWTYHDDIVWHYNDLNDDWMATLFHPDHVFDIDDTDLDLYAYVIEPMYIRVHFLPSLTDNLDDLRMIVDGVEYADGEYILPVTPYYTQGYTNFFGYSYSWAKTPNYYLFSSGTKFYPASTMGWRVQEAFRRHDVSWNYDCLYMANWYYTDAYNLDTYYRYTDSTDGHTVYYPDNNYIGSGWTYGNNLYAGENYIDYFPGETFDMWFGADGRITVDYCYSNAGQTTTTETVWLGSGYNPNPRSTSTSRGYSRAGYVFMGLSTQPDQPGTAGYSESNLICDGKYNRLRSFDLVQNNTLYCMWAEEGSETAPDEPTREAHTLTVYNEGTTIGMWKTQVSTGSTVLSYLSETLVHEGGKQYYFYGYYTEPNGQGERITRDTVMPDNDLTVYAYWSTEHATVYFLNQGPATNGILYLFGGIRDKMRGYTVYYSRYYDSTTGGLGFVEGQPLTAGMIPRLTTTDPYNFVGWFDINGNQLMPDTVVADGSIYYARWASPENDTHTFTYNYSLAWSDGSIYKNSTYGNVLFSFSITAPEGTTIPARAVDIVVPFNPSAVFSTTLKVGDFFVYEYRADGKYHIYNPQAITGEAGFNNANFYIDERYGYGLRELPFEINIDEDTSDDVVDVTITKSLYLNYATSSSSGGSLRLIGTGYRDTNGDIVVNWRVDDSYSIRGAVSRYVTMTPNMGATIETEGVDVYDRHFDGRAGYTITMRYPAAAFDPEAQSATITQTATEFVYYYTQTYPSKYNVSGTVTVEWVETPEEHHPDDIYRNMGRAQGINSLGTNPHVYSTQRQFATLNQTQELTWWLQYGAAMDRNILADRANGYIRMAVEEGDIYYNSAAYEDYYMWNSTSERYALTEGEYTISAIRVSDYITWTQDYVDGLIAATGNDAYTRTNIPRNEDVEIWVRYEGESDYVLLTTNRGTTAGTTINSMYIRNDARSYNHDFSLRLPDNVVAVEVRSPNETGMAYHEVDFTYTVRLKPTARLQNLVNIDFTNGLNSVFKSDPVSGNVYTFNDSIVDTSWRYSNGSYEKYNAEIASYETVTWDEDCGLTIFELKSDVTSRRLYVGSTTTSVSKGSTMQTSTYNGYMFCYGSYSGDYNLMTDGSLYVLMPSDVTITSNPTLSLLGTRNGQAYNSTGNRTGYINSRYYTIDYIDNWNNTGKTLMVINYHDLDEWIEEHYSNSNSNFNGVIVNFTFGKSVIDLRYNNANRNAQFDILGVDRSPNAPEYTGIYSNPFTASSDSRYRRLISIANENLDYPLGASYTDTTFSAESVTQYGFSEYVANSSGIYDATAEVFPGELYSYRYVYAHNAAGNNVSDLRISSTLDGYGLWRGITATTLNAKTAEGANLTVEPVIWYCTTVNPDFANVDADHGWTTTEPSQTDTVYGVVVDYSHAADGTEAIITGASPVLVTIHQLMNAPIGTEFQSTGVSHVNVLPENTSLDTTSTVTGTVVAPNIEVTINTTPTSGTADAPAQVHPADTINYDISIRNNTNRTLNNIVVTDTFPEGITFTLDDITLWNGTKIADYEGFSDVVLENNVLTFTVNKLNQYNSTRIIVHAVAGETPAVLPDTAYVTSYNGYDISDNPYTSNTVYHEIVNDVRIPDPTGVRGQIMQIIMLSSIAGLGLIGFVTWMVISKKKEEKEHREGQNEN